MRFSKPEIIDLLKSWLAVSLIFTIALAGFKGAVSAFPFIVLTAGIGFLFHELGHKFVAQRNGCLANFQANGSALIFGLVLSFFGVVLVAPGGVLVRGASRSVHGRIALAGPLVNIFLSVFFAILFFYFEVVFFRYGFAINAFLALFNLIPFPPFDGGAVIVWNKFWYFLSVFLAVVLVVFSY